LRALCNRFSSSDPGNHDVAELAGMAAAMYWCDAVLTVLPAAHIIDRDNYMDHGDFDPESPESSATSKEQIHQERTVALDTTDQLMNSFADFRGVFNRIRDVRKSNPRADGHALKILNLIGNYKYEDGLVSAVRLAVPSKLLLSKFDNVLRANAGLTERQRTPLDILVAARDAQSADLSGKRSAYHAVDTMVEQFRAHSWDAVIAFDMRAGPLEQQQVNYNLPHYGLDDFLQNWLAFDSQEQALPPYASAAGPPVTWLDRVLRLWPRPDQVATADLLAVTNRDMRKKA
jgi:hypothetical protein